MKKVLVILLAAVLLAEPTAQAVSYAPPMLASAGSGLLDSFLQSFYEGLPAAALVGWFAVWALIVMLLMMIERFMR